MRFLLVLAAVAGVPRVATGSPLLSATVDKTGGFSVSVDGKSWLQSGTLRIHANDAWHATTGGTTYPSSAHPLLPVQHPCFPILPPSWCEILPQIPC